MNAIILYDKFDLAVNANVMLERATLRAEGTTHWNVKLWRLDMLMATTTAAAALKDAAEAHLIVLAVRDPADRSPQLLDWLEQWADRRQVQDAALAVCDRGNGNTLSATASPCLSQFAQRHGLSFILSNGAPPEDEPAGFARDLYEREVAVTPTLRHIMDEPVTGYSRHSGINE